jgi:hypothetical protein
MTSIILKRLAFIKYLFGQALEQSKRPEPLASIAVLSVHNSVELFLQLSTETLDCKDSNNFMDYWDSISLKLPNGQILPQKESMRRLNKARVALKHSGIYSSKLDIDSHLESARTFFDESTPMVFAMSFTDVSLADYIQIDTVKQRVKQAEANILESDIDKAIDNLGIAFSELLLDYEDNGMQHRQSSPFNFGDSLASYKGTFWGSHQKDSSFGLQFPAFAKKVANSISEMQKAIKILALGIDYRRYLKFNSMLPSISKSLDGTYRTVRSNFSPAYQATKDDAEFGLNFVIEVSIAFQDFDYKPSRSA